ncbi:MAG: D-TA family PLP-dependent enzyme [Verrucomicrobia bacterium]|nr:D-TA family PLP-dependent enzyme [Verrucomicrobiota bacterium]
MTPQWMLLENEAEAPSPSLLIIPDRVEENLRRMIAIAGSPARLRPHIKTHKLPQIVALQVELGVTKCKGATIAEAEMAARAGATDVLLAAQLVGPNVARFLALGRAFPHVAFSTLSDDAEILSTLNQAALAAGTTIEVLIDLDVGQHRTGVAPGPAAVELYRILASSPGLRPGGLHAYDGHLHQSDPVERTAAADAAAAQVSALRAELARQRLPVPRVVCGGTPTFPMHARRAEVECSPGTCVLWDAGYRTKLPDLDFQNAAVLLTRVVSRPDSNRLCVDLGHKSVASEMPHPRVIFPALPDARAVGHNEEHLVLETARAGEFRVGSVLYGLPWHICPTVALHDRVQVVRQGRVTEEWQVTARARRLTF